MASASELKKISDRIEKMKEEVALKSVQDGDFRASLVRDPKAALAEEYGLEPDFFSSISIRIVEEQPNELLLNIPAPVAEGELSEEELEAVAGGVAFGVGAAGVAIAAAGVFVASATIVQNSRAGRSW